MDEHEAIARAAREDIPEQYAKFLGVEIVGEQATAWLLMNGPRDWEPYEVRLFKIDGAWRSASGSGGFSMLTPDHILRCARQLGWT